MADIITFDNLAPLLEQYAQEFRNAYQDELIRRDKIASGGLLNSIEYRVETEGTTYAVILTLNKYWKWVEKGRRPGKFPPTSAILRWIEVKPVIPRPDEKGRVPSPKSLAYLIGRKIAREGIEPAPAMAGTKAALNARWVPLLREALAKDTRRWITSAIFETAVRPR